MKKRVFEIRLYEVTFTPTTFEIDTKTGADLTPRKTIIGKLSYDCDCLPEKIKQELVEIIRVNMLKNLKAA